MPLFTISRYFFGHNTSLQNARELSLVWERYSRCFELILFIKTAKKTKKTNKKTLWLKFLKYRLKSTIISLVQLQANLTRARHVVTLWEYAPSRSGLTFKIHQRNSNGLITRSPKREAQPIKNTQLYIWKLCFMGKNVFFCVICWNMFSAVLP